MVAHAYNTEDQKHLIISDNDFERENIQAKTSNKLY